MRLKLIVTKLLFLVVLALLAACQSAPPVLPTQALDAQASEEAQATIAALSATPTATSARPTLPPEPTATPTFTPEPTRTLRPQDQPTEQTAGGGMIYYIYNQDSIARVPADGSAPSELIVRFNGGRITDLSASPQGDLLTFVAPGAGSAREVFVSNLDGSYVQQVSCLGFSRVRSPAWQPGTDLIAFIAAQTESDPMSIYVARVGGAGNCPADNGQRILVPLQRPVLTAEGEQMVGGLLASELLWSSDGTRLFASDDDIIAVYVPTGGLFTLTDAAGFGPDFSLTYSPQEDLLYYLRSTAPNAQALGTAQVYLVDVSGLAAGETRDPMGGGRLTAGRIRWSADGSAMLIVEGGNISLLTRRTGTAVRITSGLVFPPDPIFSPDNTLIAYIGVTTDPPAQQIFVLDRTGANLLQITQHPEGTVQNLVWSAP